MLSRTSIGTLILTIPAAISLSTSARAAEATSSPERLGELEVVGEIVYRDRVDTTPPVLEYGLDYFERFEPLTLGDMLRRVPGVGFLSDVLEYDGVRMRGLDSAYTKIMINGKRVPGSDVDRSFFVDRIPAELIDRVEIVRSSSADVSAEGTGGALNIVLKESVELEGGYLRAGGLYFDDEETKGTAGGVFGGALGEYRYKLGANVQGRHNPKAKLTNFFDSDDVFVERELESDVRDGTDYSFSAALNGPLGPIRFGIDAFYVMTDRTEREDVQIIEVDGSVFRLDALEAQDEDIEQENYSAALAFALPVGDGATTLDLSYARFKDDIVETAFEADPGDPLEPVELEINDTTDSEAGVTLAHVFKWSDGRLKLGVDYLDKDRDASVKVFEIEDGVPEDATPPNGIFEIKEQRLDPFVKYEHKWRRFSLEAGVRHEMTDVDVTGDASAVAQDYGVVAPSLHLKWALSDADRVYTSFARTVRRPDFDLIAPFELEEEPADEDTLRGNPLLEPEKAWGVDVGYERRVGARGVVGLNLFYRDVDDVIELVSTGEDSGNGGFIFTPQNVNDGEVWGVELDLSTPLPLAVFGLPETGVFLNAAYLDSEIEDAIFGGKRRFQNQPDYIVNAGVIQNLPSIGVAFGATYREQGVGTQIVLGEVRDTSYDGDLEVFIEKRFGENWVARLTASNLLDTEKIEDIYNFDGDSVAEIRDNMLNGAIDEFEFENEKAGQVYQFVIRATF